MDEIISKAIEGGIPVLLVVAGLFFIFVAIAEIEKIKVPSTSLRFLLGIIGSALFFTGTFAYFHGLDSTLSETTEIPEPVAEIPNELSSEWFSSGEMSMFNHSNPDRDFGIAEFSKGNYAQAVDFFEKAILADPNDPEIQIYLNNSEIRESTSRVVLAAVVPVEKEQNYAEATLRGVADSQRMCNRNQNAAIEIVIADDANSLDRVSKLSEQIVEMRVEGKEIIGVIGHLTSATTKEGLKVYEQNDLATISPTSTSDFLQSEVFFRTPPSDKLSGRELASYITRSLGKVEVEVLYTPDDPYSESLLRAFKSEFEDSGGTLEEQDISDEKLDPESLINSLDEKVDAIVFLPSTDFSARAVAIARVAKKLTAGNALPMFGGDTLYSPEILQDGGSAVEGLVIAVPWFSTEKSEYAVKAKERWEGQVNWVTAMSFDATQAFCYAISSSPSMSRSEILRSLRSVSLPASDTSGMRFSFDSAGDATRLPVLVKVVNALEDPEIDTPANTNYGFKLIKQ